MTSLVTRGDFSEVLAQETPVPTMKNGVQVQQFAVDVAGQRQHYPMNEYIAFFHSYDQANGPFRFSGETGATNTVTMHFTGSKTAKTLNLTFHLAGGQWQEEIPVVD